MRQPIAPDYSRARRAPTLCLLASLFAGAWPGGVVAVDDDEPGENIPDQPTPQDQRCVDDTDLISFTRSAPYASESVPVELRWNVRIPAGCSGTQVTLNGQTVPATGTRDVQPTFNRPYVLRVMRNVVAFRELGTQRVTPCARAMFGNIRADEESIDAGEETTLRWSVSAPSQCANVRVRVNGMSFSQASGSGWDTAPERSTRYRLWVDDIITRELDSVSVLVDDEPVEKEVVHVPDVVEQFDALDPIPEAIGFRIGSSPNPSTCRHYQGIVRTSGPGVPFLIVSRSDNLPDGLAGAPCTVADREIGDEPGSLVFVRMGSRDRTGERLRSNKMRPGRSIQSTTPPADDIANNFVLLNGRNGWPNYAHPGGMQVIGDVLAVTLETPLGNESHSMVLFVDISDPTNPVPGGRFVISPGLPGASGVGAGAVAVTPMPDGRYLMAVTGKDNERVLVFVSDRPGGVEPLDLADPDLDWHFRDVWHKSTDGRNNPWPTGGPTNYQTINFVREGGTYGDLYLIGTFDDCSMGGRNAPWPFGCSPDQFVDLHRVSFDGISHFGLSFVRRKELREQASVQGPLAPMQYDLLAAAGTYVSPSGELILYAAEHDNDGANGSVKAVEFTHRNVVRPNSPTLRHTVETAGPRSIPEGGQAFMSAAGHQPITKAWMKLNDRYGRQMTIDFDDWAEEDHGNFKRFECVGIPGCLTNGFNDVARAWRYFAPRGCTLRANQHTFDDGNFPGRHSKTLAGTGRVEEDPDLGNVASDHGTDDMEDRVSSMEFRPDCDDYYRSGFDIAWDLDRNGSFETAGQFVQFRPDDIDGPGQVNVRVQARHGADGRRAIAIETVRIVNVAPRVRSFELHVPGDPGRDLDTRPALIGQPIELDATFTDPGVLDTHELTIDWGDGWIDFRQSVDQFDPATGGSTGRVRHGHTYSTPGTYEVVLDMADDDGGRVSRRATVVVIAASSEEVTIDIDPLAEPGEPLGRAAGSFSGARESADLNQYLVCRVQVIAVESPPYMVCEARDRDRRTLTCLSAEPAYVDAVLGIKNYAHIAFTATEDDRGVRRCTALEVTKTAELAR